MRKPEFYFYTSLRMFIRQYCNLEVPVTKLRLYLRTKAATFKQTEKETSYSSPVEISETDDFMKLEDLVIYMFDITPFSKEYNETLYSPSSTMVKIGGTELDLIVTVSELFSYAYDKKIYEEDRRNFAKFFYEKLKNYFDSTNNRVGIPVIFNTFLYLIIDVTMNPAPSVFMLDPHDMAYLGDKFMDKKKMVPMQYILGSPTGATLLFPPIDDEVRNRIKTELESLL